MGNFVRVCSCGHPSYRSRAWFFAQFLGGTAGQRKGGGGREVTDMVCKFYY